MIYENFPAAYGEYNEMTIEVANARNQKLVNWDFEYVTFSFLVRDFNPSFFLRCFFIFIYFGYVAREIRRELNRMIRKRGMMMLLGGDPTRFYL